MIEWVEIQLVAIGSAFLDVEIVPYDNLDEFWSLAEESAIRFEHTVAWIDCLRAGAKFGRGVFIARELGRRTEVRASIDDRTFKSVPFEVPGFALNRLLGRGLQRVLLRSATAEAEEDPAALFARTFIRWTGSSIGTASTARAACSNTNA